MRRQEIKDRHFCDLGPISFGDFVEDCFRLAHPTLEKRELSLSRRRMSRTAPILSTEPILSTVKEVESILKVVGTSLVGSSILEFGHRW